MPHRCIHSSNRRAIYRAEEAGLIRIDRPRSNRYFVYPLKRPAALDRAVRAAQRKAQTDPLGALEILRRADAIRWRAK